MALPSFCTQSLIRLRAGEKDSRGSIIKDWSDPDTLTISGCSVQPTGETISTDGRVMGVSEGFVAYTPIDADIKEGDRLTYKGLTFEVTSVQNPWFSPTGSLDHLIVGLTRYAG